jgi:7,8-dihydro-6-hydroxymethylpterin dimethyltransferase
VLKELRVFNAEPEKPRAEFDERLERIAGRLRKLNEDEARTQFSLLPTDVLIKTTISLCPDCLAHVPAAVIRRNRSVRMSKRCEVHGPSEAVLENDADFYRVSSKDQWGRAYTDSPRFDIPSFGASCCGQTVGAVSDRPCCSVSGLSSNGDYSNQMDNKTCTVLVEITDACNLMCRVCYSDSKGDRILTFETFKDHVMRLVREKGTLDSVQITGGEASLHPQFWEILEWLYEQKGVGKIYLPTNGLLFDRPEICTRLSRFKDRVLVLLQFDGRDQVSNAALRRAEPQRLRSRLIRKLDRAGIAMQLTMTLSRGVSEEDIAWVVAQGLRHKNVRLVAMQPAFFSGRYELEPDGGRRLTLSDCVKGVVAGFAGKAKESDFLPIPCSHPNCGWVTLFARRFGLVRNIARHVDLNAVMNEVAYKTLLSKSEMQGIVGTRGSRMQQLIARLARRLIQPRHVFGIVIKPFMDRFNYDQDRVSSCCHHILDTHGNLVSFCEYNARLRRGDSWNRFPRIGAPDPAPAIEA